MRDIIYYQISYDRFKEVTKQWKKKCITLLYRKPYYKTNIITFTKKDFPFNSKSGELLSYVNKYEGDYSSLIVVIGKLPQDPHNYRMAFHRELYLLVLYYPEISFLFEDINDVPKWNGKEGIVSSLLCPCKSNTDIKDIKIESLISYENLFDASNIRSAAKAEKQKELNLKNNYHTWEHRKNHMAIIVDEEVEQCMLNSYLLFANGYRALPISSLDALQRYCSQDRNNVSYDYIFRDFDLQFPDDPCKKFWVFPNEGEPGGLISQKIFTIDFIRGYKYDDKSEKWLDFINDEIKICEVSEETSAPSDCEEYHDSSKEKVWRAAEYECGKVKIITQGYTKVTIEPNRKRFERTDTRSELCVPGLKKPIEGVYYDIHKIKEIENEYWNIRKNNKPISTVREDRNHSSPLDLYDIAESLTKRAQNYYNRGRFVLSAILSEEALEILNGHHSALTIKSYHLLAISENAIAMSVIGCNEDALRDDCKIRSSIIKEDIKRLTRNTEQDSQNVLNQIFTDCRLFCKEKEHFQSEDVFIREMAYLNYGWSASIKKIINRLEYLFKTKQNNTTDTYEKYDSWPDN